MRPPATLSEVPRRPWPPPRVHSPSPGPSGAGGGGGGGGTGGAEALLGPVTEPRQSHTSCPAPGQELQPSALRMEGDGIGPAFLNVPPGSTSGGLRPDFCPSVPPAPSSQRCRAPGPSTSPSPPPGPSPAPLLALLTISSLCAPGRVRSPGSADGQAGNGPTGCWPHPRAPTRKPHPFP